MEEVSERSAEWQELHAEQRLIRQCKKYQSAQKDEINLLQEEYAEMQDRYTAQFARKYRIHSDSEDEWEEEQGYGEIHEYKEGQCVSFEEYGAPEWCTEKWENDERSQDEERFGF